MLQYNIVNGKKLNIYDFCDFYLYNDDPVRGRIYFSAYDDKILHCVQCLKYAKIF